MKRNTFIFIALFVGCLSAGAQVKTIRGHVPYYQNCIVEVYNRNIKAKVDAKGFFVLPNVTDDDVLVFYNRGKKTNSSNSYAVARINHTVISEIPAPLGEPELTINRDTAGVAFVNENTKSNTIYQDTYHNNYSSSINIGSIRQKRNTDFTINNPNPLVFDVAYTTFVDFATAGRLPEIAENALNYEPADFFRTGVSFGNTLDLKIPTFAHSVTSVSLGQKRTNSPVPNVNATSYNASLAINNMRKNNFISDAGAMFLHSEGQLVEHGSNLASLLQSAYTYPALRENPLEKAKNMPDNDKKDNFNAYFNTYYSYKRWQAYAKANYTLEKSERQNEIYGSTALYNRNEQIHNVMANAFVNRECHWEKTGLDVSADYHFNSIFDKLKTNVENLDLNRNTHNVRYSAQLGFGDYYYNNYYFDDGFRLNFSNLHYFSNTAKAKDYVNLFPEAGFEWSVQEFWDDLLNDILDYYYSKNVPTTRLHGKISRSIGETDLLYRNYSPLSTLYNVFSFNPFREYDLPTINLKPEIYLNREIGLNIYNTYGENHYFLGINYFNNTTKDFVSSYVSSVQSAGLYGLKKYAIQNVGALHNYGIDISLFTSFKYDNWFDNYWFDGNIGFTLNFNRSRTKVTDLYANEPFVRIGGFDEIATVAAKGETLGAIYGRTYVRNAQGEIQHNSYGEPEMNVELTKIGDPTPDFVLSLVTDFDIRQRFNFSFTMKLSAGGDRINLTRAMLEHYGISGEKTLATFPQAQSYGIFEDFIESATYFSIPNLTISYDFIHNKRVGWFTNLRVAASAKNLVFASAYKGTPTSLLFGYPSAAGLDLYNLPLIRNYSLSLMVNF